MKFKEGDRVRVIRNLKVGKIYKDSVSGKTDSTTSEMVALAGQIVTIASVTDKYRIKEEGWNWTDSMFQKGVVIRERKKKIVKKTSTTSKKKKAVKFKIGNRVQNICVLPAEEQPNKGKFGIIKGIDSDGTVYVTYEDGMRGSSLTPEEDYKIVGAKAVNFILKYDLDEDPIEEFETIEEVEKRIDFLVEHVSSLKKDSMVIYEVAKKYKVNVKTLITKKVVK